jgi:hypothetical protein
MSNARIALRELSRTMEVNFRLTKVESALEKLGVKL